MGIEQHPYFKVVCDECGEAFPEHESGGGYTLYETEKEAREEVFGHDGAITADGKTFCCGCVDEKRAEDADALNEETH